MSSIRYYRPDLVYEVTARTIDGRFWFDPEQNPEIAEAFHAIFARAQQRYGVTIYAYFVMSNHYHALYAAPDPDALADFLNHVHAAMARYANFAHGKRKGPVFAGRSHVVPVLAEESALLRRLAYVMGQAIKTQNNPGLEGWRGANTNSALLHGTQLVGTYFDRHRKTLEARRKHGPQADEAYVSHPVVEVSVLPCWQDLAPDEQRRRYAAVGAAAVERFERKGGIVQDPDNWHDFDVNFGSPPAEPPAPEPPTTPADRPAPKRDRRRKALVVHAANTRSAAAFEAAYAAVCDAHETARSELRRQTARALQGKRAKAVIFPVFTFAAVARTGRLRRLATERTAQSHGTAAPAPAQQNSTAAGS